MLKDYCIAAVITDSPARVNLQFRIRNRPVDPSIALGSVRIVVLAAIYDLHCAGPPYEQRQKYRTATAGDNRSTNFDLSYVRPILLDNDMQSIMSVAYSDN